MKEFWIGFNNIASLGVMGIAIYCFTKNDTATATFFLVWAVLLKVPFLSA
jgi:ammonia channel protein AmtB